MTREQAIAIGMLWRGWSAGRKIDNCAHREFLRVIVSRDTRLSQIDCFEVLDAITNQTAWENFGRIPLPRGITGWRESPQHVQTPHRT